jgi:hypothetical protein
MSIERVVVFSREDDIHAFALKRVAEDVGGPPVTILDTSVYPEHEFCFRWTDGVPSLHFRGPMPVVISASTAVWWRRPQGFSPSPEIVDPRMRRFVVTECDMTLEGGLAACSCHIVNDLFSERRASNKILQLQLARDIGFVTPETCVTNSVSDAEEMFREHNGDIVFKGQTDARFHLGETRPVTSAILEKSDKLRYAPVQFQWKVPCKHDLRVTVVGEDVFATRIDSGGAERPIDWRLDQSIPMEPCELDSQVVERCRALTRRLGLLYGAIDLRETPDGDLYFFEINPSGQFLFSDTPPDLPITQALYSLLTDTKMANNAMHTDGNSATLHSRR